MSGAARMANACPDPTEVTDESLGINDLPAEALHLIFGFLAPRELCRTSAVCKAWRDLNKDASANRVWESHYAKRWRAPWTKAGSAWQVQYSHKMRNARAFSSKGLADILYGHTAAVTAISLLPASNILATGSADNTVRLWDLEAGLPMACSRNLKHTVRTLSLDDAMLACGGGQDGAIRLWRSHSSSGPSKFDLTLPTKLSGHTGPVVSLASDKRLLYSASWDCSVRLWSKTTLRRESLLAFPDWVHSAKPCGSHLLVTAGRTLHICNAETGQTIGKHMHSALPGNINWETGRPTSPLQVEGSQDSRLVFLAGSDGAIVALDPRTTRQTVSVLWDQNSAVKGLSFEDPWLAAATYSGSILLLDIESALKGGRGGDVSSSSSSAATKKLCNTSRATRQRFTGPRGPALCVDMADCYLACGSGDPVVRTWAFQHKETEQRRPISAPRGARNTRRLRNRFAFSPSSDEDDGSDEQSDAESGEPAIRDNDCSALSQSLPAHLGTQCPENQHRPRNVGISKRRLAGLSFLHGKSPASPLPLTPSCSPETSPCSPQQSAGSFEGRDSAAYGISDSEASQGCLQTQHKPEREGSTGTPREQMRGTRHRGALVPIPLRCRAEARRMIRCSIDN